VQQPTVETMFGAVVLSVVEDEDEDEDDDGVTAVVRADDGQELTVRADYLLGCDGAAGVAELGAGTSCSRSARCRSSRRPVSRSTRSPSSDEKRRATGRRWNRLRRSRWPTGYCTPRHRRCLRPSQRAVRRRRGVPDLTQPGAGERDPRRRPTLRLDATIDDPRPSYLERFIHAAIYRARHDVGAVLHHHSPAVLPFTISSRRLVPVTHVAGFLADGAPVFEIRDVGGSRSNLVIGSNELGAALADALGDSAVVLMRGHGATVVGATIEQAVHRAVYTEYNARALASAVALGPDPTCLTRAEADAADQATSTQAHRAWDYWSAQVQS